MPLTARVRKRKPVKRFVEWTFSKKRLNRIKQAEKEYDKESLKLPDPTILRRESSHKRPLFREGAGRIFTTAEKLLEAELKVKSMVDSSRKIIFIGQAMRPLFEAVRGLNEVWQAFPRKNLKYVVTPTRVWFGKEIVKSEYTQQVSKISETLKRRNIIPKGKCDIFIIDYRIGGILFKAIYEAIREINPQAKLSMFSQDSFFGEGILAAEKLIPKPTVKENKASKTQLNASDEIKRSQYILYQKLMQDWLEKKKSES